MIKFNINNKLVILKKFQANNVIPENSTNVQQHSISKTIELNDNK